MTTASDIKELKRLRELARAVDRKEASVRTGYFGSELDEALDEKHRSLVDREDLPHREITEHFTTLLRSLYAQRRDLTWVPSQDGDGLTDPVQSDIIIEHVFAPRDREQDLSKPTIIVRPGPSSTNNSLVQRNLKHFDWPTGAKTYTTLVPGTIQILVKAKHAATASDEAEWIRNNLIVLNDEIRFRTLHDINNVAVGGYDEENKFYNRKVNNVEAAVVPITLTYYYQITSRIGPRPGVFESAKLLWKIVSRVEEPSVISQPYIDGRAEAGVELGDDVVVFGILPVEDPSEDAP